MARTLEETLAELGAAGNVQGPDLSAMRSAQIQKPRTGWGAEMGAAMAKRKQGASAGMLKTRMQELRDSGLSQEDALEVASKEGLINPKMLEAMRMPRGM